MKDLVVVLATTASLFLTGIVGCGESTKERNFAKDFVQALNDMSGGGKRFSLVKAPARVTDGRGQNKDFSIVLRDNTPGRQRTVAVILNRHESEVAQAQDYLSLSDQDLLDGNGIAEFANFFDVEVDTVCSTDSFGDTDCTTFTEELYIGLATTLIYNEELLGKNTLGMDEQKYNLELLNTSEKIQSNFMFSNEASLQTAEVLLMANHTTDSQASNTQISDYVEVKMGFDANDLQTKFQNSDWDGLSKVVQSRTYATPEGMENLQDTVQDIVTGAE